jgi:hypothetical protein
LNYRHKRKYEVSLAFFQSIELSRSNPIGDYPGAQHFLYFNPLPHGHGSLRPALIAAGLDPRVGSRRPDTRLASGSRLCRKKRFNPAQR